MPKKTSFTYKKNGKKYSLKRCFVPLCENRNFKTKIFLPIPKDDRRAIWFSIVEKEFNKYDKYCCEDHFNLEEDCINWATVNRNNNANVKLKPNIVPHKKLRQPENYLKDIKTLVCDSPKTENTVSGVDDIVIITESDEEIPEDEDNDRFAIVTTLMQVIENLKEVSSKLKEVS